MKTRLLPACLAVAALLCTNGYSQPTKHQGRTTSATKVRTYYLCAEEVDWDYTPDGIDVMMGRDFDGYGKAFTEHTANRIGRTYRKAVFHEYTDATFSTKKPRSRTWRIWDCSGRYSCRGGRHDQGSFA